MGKELKIMNEQILRIKMLMKFSPPLPKMYDYDIDEITDIDFLKECRLELDTYMTLGFLNLDVFDRRIKELEN